MLVESAFFDPNPVQQGRAIAEDDLSQTHLPNCSPSFSMEDLHPYHQKDPSQHHHRHLQQHRPQEVAAAAAAGAMEMGLQQRVNNEMDQGYSCINNNTTNLQEVVDQDSTRNQILSSCDPSNWEEMTFGHHHHHHHHHELDHRHHQPMQQVEMQNLQHHSFTMPSLDTPYSPTPDFLNMLPLPRCSPSTLLIPNSSISFANSSTQESSNFLSSLGLPGDISGANNPTESSFMYDPQLTVNLPPQPPLLRELIQSFPNCCNLGGSRSVSLFTEVNKREASDGLFQDGDGRSCENGVFEFTSDMKCRGKGRDGKDREHVTTESQRRMLLNDKYIALRSLVPNPTKTDRASAVGDAIGYISELKRTVGELKILVEKKRCSRERLKRQNIKDGAEGTADKTEDDLDQPYNGSLLRVSWLHRKSKNTEVDIRIIDDEVTVKLVQQKRINSLLFVSKVLDELQLDLHHVAGGLTGDYYSFLFNSKICEGSTVNAHAIANKLTEFVDNRYAAFQPPSSY